MDPLTRRRRPIQHPALPLTLQQDLTATNSNGTKPTPRIDSDLCLIVPLTVAAEAAAAPIITREALLVAMVAVATTFDPAVDTMDVVEVEVVPEAVALRPGRHQ